MYFRRIVTIRSDCWRGIANTFATDGRFTFSTEFTTELQAQLYNAEPRALTQAGKRNLERFPEDFMFQVTDEELENLKSQIVISSWGGVRHRPYAFSKQGIAMLSSVLRSPVAIQINISIIREFVAIRRFLISHQDLVLRLNHIEEK
ncbi:MAG: ORF6N domain-containing protein [Pseudobdellovibrionaceae bacterium]